MMAASDPHARAAVLVGRVMAHEMNNVLAAIEGGVRLARVDSPGAFESIDEMISPLLVRGTSLLRSFAAVSGGDGDVRSTPVSLIVPLVVDWGNRVGRGSVRVVAESVANPRADGDAIVRCEPAHFAYATVLLVDALKGTSAGDAVDVRVVPSVTRDTAGIRFRAAPGERRGKAEADRVAEAIDACAVIAERHGGRLVEQVIGDGQGRHEIDVTIELPRDVPQPPRYANGDRAGETRRGRHVDPDHRATVLYADDEQMLTDVVAISLERRGYRVLVASNGGAGIELLHREAGRISAVVTDLSMPDVPGRDFARYVREFDPAIPVVLVTGELVTGTDPLGDGTPLLLKPFTIDDLQRTIERVIDTNASK